MATLARVRVTWTGVGVVGEGVSTFYSSNSNPATYMAAVRTFFSNLAGLFPDDLIITFPGDGDTIEDSTGELNGAWTSTAPASVTGTQTGGYAAGVGARVKWVTAGFTRGRRVRGSTFLVPIAANQYQNNGTLDDGAVTSIAAAAGNVVTADGGSMRIWSRPSTPGGSDGDSHAVTAAQAPDTVSWLRTRRT